MSKNRSLASFVVMGLKSEKVGLSLNSQARRQFRLGKEDNSEMLFVLEKRKGAAAPFVFLIFEIRRFLRLDLRSVVFLRADDLEYGLCVSVPVDPVYP